MPAGKRAGREGEVRVFTTLLSHPIAGWFTEKENSAMEISVQGAYYGVTSGPIPWKGRKGSRSGQREILSCEAGPEKHGQLWSELGS